MNYRYCDICGICPEMKKKSENGYRCAMFEKELHVERPFDSVNQLFHVRCKACRDAEKEGKRK